MSFRSLLLAACLIYFSNQPAHALTDVEHAAFEARGEAVIAEFTPRLRSALPESEWFMLSATRFHFLRSEELDARAYIVNGVPTVEVTTGLLAILDDLAMASTHSFTMGAGPCLYEFQLYLYRELQSGNRSLTNLVKPEQLVDVDCGCRRFSRSALLANKYGSRGADGGFKLNLLFVLLHEIGHHVHRDLSNGKPGSSAQEIAADTWAIETSLKARVPLQSTMPVAALLFEIETMRERGATGTAPGDGTGRFAKFIQTFLQIIDDGRFPKQFDASVYQQLKTNIQSYSKFVMSLPQHSQAQLKSGPCASDRIDDYQPFFDRTMSTFH